MITEWTTNEIKLKHPTNIDVESENIITQLSLVVNKSYKLNNDQRGKIYNSRLATNW